METRKKKHSYVEWLDPGEMHQASTQWMSELKFVRDEQLFLNNLVKSYTLQLVDSNIFDESKKVIYSVLKAEKKVVNLMKKVQSHENLLEIMINDVDELKMEKAYTETHWDLTSEMNHYMADYRNLKSCLFKLVSKVMKKQKQKRLLN